MIFYHDISQHKTCKCLNTLFLLQSHLLHSYNVHTYIASRLINVTMANREVQSEDIIGWPWSDRQRQGNKSTYSLPVTGAFPSCGMHLEESSATQAQDLQLVGAEVHDLDLGQESEAWPTSLGTYVLPLLAGGGIH